jgi:hypothetical protein
MPDAKPAVVEVPLPDVCGHFERGPSETKWRRTDTPELDHAPNPAAPAGHAGATHTDPHAGTGTGGTGTGGTGTSAPAAGAGTGSSSGTTSP